MSDANIISIAITLFAIAAGSLFNNVRISDLATATNKRFDDVRDRISDVAGGTNKRFDDMRDLMRSENSRLESVMRTESARTQDKLDAVLKLLGELDTRVTHLEERGR